MKIYIDESGSYSIGDQGRQQEYSISCSVALVVPEIKEAALFKAFEAWKQQPELKETLDVKGEIKGSNLSESQFHSLLSLLVDFNLICEINAIDLTDTTDKDIEAHKSGLANLHNSTEAGQNKNKQMGRDVVLSLSNPNYVQMLAISTLAHRTLYTAIPYYAQRLPEELGNFEWHIDAKDPKKINMYEQSLEYLIKPILQKKTFTDPVIRLTNADYQHFDKFDLSGEFITEPFRSNNDVKIFNIIPVMENINFTQSHNNLGLQIVDILSNCARRAMHNRLQFDGWKYLSNLLVYPQNSPKNPAVTITRFGKEKAFDSDTSLSRFVNYFRECGKKMIVPPEIYNNIDSRKNYFLWSYLNESLADNASKRIWLQDR